MKKNILIWAGWYPANENDNTGIFIKKHIEVISSFNNIYVFTIKHKKNLWTFKKHTINERFGKVHYYHIPDFLPLKLLGYFFIPVLETFKAKKELKTIDIFHLHISYPYAAFAYFISFFNIKKWILTEHWSGFTRFDNTFNKLNFLFRFLLLQQLKKFYKISVVSQFLKNELSYSIPVLKNKINLTYNVINFPPSIQKPEQRQEFNLLTISNLIDYPKNISFLIQVLAETIKVHSNIKLDIYGDGKDKQKFIQLTKDLNLLDKHVFFKGKIPNSEIIKIYQRYHAFILLSKFETFSVVTAEALACGIPVIVTKCGGPEEYVLNQQNGYLVELHNIEQTKTAILNLIKNYHQFDPQKIQQSVIEKFSPHIVQQQFQTLYS